MRLLGTICLLLLSFGILTAQNTATLSTDIDERLLVRYDQNYLEQLQANHPVLLQRLNYYLDHAWYITAYPTEKELSDLPSVTIKNLTEMNILLLEMEQQLQRDFYEQTIYQIADTDQILVYHSAQRFYQNFERLRRE